MLAIIKNLALAIVILILMAVLFITIIMIMWIVGSVVLGIIVSLFDKEDEWQEKIYISVEK